MIRVLRAKISIQRSSTLPCLFHNNLSFKIILEQTTRLKRGKVQLGRAPVLACSTLYILYNPLYI